MPNTLPDYSFITDFFIGGLAGAISRTLTAPFERMKLLLQTQNSNPQLRARPYKGLTDCGKRIFYEEGLRAFWRGNSAAVALSFPVMSFNFAFRGMYRCLINLEDPTLDENQFVLRSILVGGLSGISTLFIVYPLELIRTRMGVDNAVSSQFNSTYGCAKIILKTDGFRGLYNGLGISIPSTFIFRGLHFGLFDIAKKYTLDYENRHLLYKYLIAQCVSTFSEFATYPLDTIRRTLMMNSACQGKQRFGIIRCAKRLYRIEGIRGFYKGNLINVLRSTSSSLVLILYDEIKSLFEASK